MTVWFDAVCAEIEGDQNVSLCATIRELSTMAQNPVMFHLFYKAVSVVTLAIFLAQYPLLAQQGNATIVGLVQDPSGGAIPHAKLTAHNLRTGLERTAETTELGEYTLPALDSGDYSI